MVHGLLGTVKSVDWLFFSIFRPGIGDGIVELFLRKLFVYKKYIKHVWP